MLIGWVGSGLSRLGLASSVFRGHASPSPDPTISRTANRRELERRSDRVRYHLGRGRRHREAGRFEEAAREAQRAIELNPGNPWAYALLGQTLMRQERPELQSARRALEHACALDPANGYFVRLLLDVLNAQGDRRAREDALAWAWWKGAPVERWLPDGPPIRRTGTPTTAGRPVGVGEDRRVVPAVREPARA